MSLTNKQTEALIRLSRAVNKNFPSSEEAVKGVTDAMKDKYKKQIEWKNGDKCIYKNNNKLVLTYIGEHTSKAHHVVNCERNGLTSIAHGYLEKPPTKEKRWLVYDAKGNFCSEHDYKYEPFDETLQVYEIEINV